MHEENECGETVVPENKAKRPAVFEPPALAYQDLTIKERAAGSRLRRS